MQTPPIIHYLNRNEGMARQGDVLIWPLPDEYVPSVSNPIKARDGRIILLEGEATGHHHSIGIRLPRPTMFRDESSGHADVSVGVASLYTDERLLDKIVQDGYLTTTSLCVGFLVVEGGPVRVEHQEHDTIQLPPGAYYVGRQQESMAGRMTYVQD
jgi:hypothetical protein